MPSLSNDAEHLRVDLLLKDPSARLADGTELVPEPRWLQWSPVPVIANPDDCEHTETLCSNCADSWGIDYWMRVYYDDALVWTSPDFPTEVNP